MHKIHNHWTRPALNWTRTEPVPALTAIHMARKPLAGTVAANALKYPVDRARGTAKKYSDL